MAVQHATRQLIFGTRDPDARGYYGAFGGRFVPETLVAPVAELEAAYFRVRQDPAFIAELEHLFTTFVGRPTPVYRRSASPRRVAARGFF